ncbi:MAG: DnaD domain protein [Mycoplasmatales bacterium]
MSKINIHIDRDLLFGYNKHGFSKDTLVIILQLLSYPDTLVNLIEFLEQTNTTNQDLEILVKKNLISIEELNTLLFINTINLVNKMSANQEQLLSVDNIHKIKYIIGRDLQAHEIEQLKGWLKQNYSLEEVQKAMSIAIQKNITNFNYIETVLFNQNKEQNKNEDTITIKRNWDID